jgi:hypothetical protein
MAMQELVVPKSIPNTLFVDMIGSSSFQVACFFELPTEFTHAG